MITNKKNVATCLIICNIKLLFKVGFDTFFATCTDIAAFRVMLNSNKFGDPQICINKCQVVKLCRIRQLRNECLY